MRKRDAAPAQKRDAQLINALAERIVLGGLIRQPQAFFQVGELLRADHFAVPVHREIFTAIKDVCESGKKLSLTLLRGRLPERYDDGKDMGSYLAVLFADSEGAPVLDFVDQIVDAWSRRSIIEVAEQVIASARDMGTNVTDAIADMEVRVSDIGQGSAEVATVSLGRLVDNVLSMSAEAYRDEKFNAGFDTGLPSLDRIVGPLRNGRLYVIGGDAKTGKTALLQQILRRAARRVPTLMAQGEMSGDELAARELSSVTKVPANSILEGNFNAFEWDMLNSAKDKVPRDNWKFFKFSEIRISQLRHRVIADKRRYGIGLLAVDHLLHVEPDRQYENMYLGIGPVVRGLKRIAIDCDIPVVVLTHRTQSSRDRNDPTPYPSDFYGGGVIERECDALICTYRRDRWLELRRPAAGNTARVNDWEVDLKKAEGKVQVALLAHRHAPFPKIEEFLFNGELTRLEEIGQTVPVEDALAL